MLKKYIVSSVLLAGILCLPFSTHAAQPGLYVGVGLGQSDDVILNQSTSAAKLFGGINLNRYLGMEISYVNLGSDYCCDAYGNTFTQDGVSYELVGYLPVSPYVDLFGKVGLFSWSITSNYYYYSSERGTNNDYGFGISAQVTPQVWLRGEYQKFLDVAGGDVNLASVSLSYYF